LLGLISIKITNKTKEIEQPKKQEVVKPKPIITKVYFVGDMMLARGVQSSVNKNFGGDFSSLFENVPELKEADILFANLEGPISENGNNVGSKYSFRIKPAVLPVLKEAGFDILSFANNHVGDWNVKAFNDTLVHLKDNNILVTGAGENKAEAEKVTIIEKNGIRFGFIGFSDVGPNWMQAKENSSGILLASDPNYASIISKAKEECDFLFVSIHFGEEYKKTHNKRQENLAHTAIDNGADMVIGHHPHVTQDMEEYNGKTIIYSLGNFIFDQYFSEDTMKGMVFEVTFEDKKVTNTKQKEVILNRSYQPKGIFEKETKREITTENNCPKPNRQFIDMSSYNVGKTNPLLELDYIPDNLIPLDTTISNEGLCLKENVKDAFVQMRNDAIKENIFIKITSAFRSWETQELLFSEKKKTSDNANLYLAKPGYSEHQLGTAIDISGSSIDYKRASLDFENTIEDIWLKNNAHKYGFIQSYPKDKEKITGYGYEPWHYRYVGVENAKYIKEHETTIIEFLGSINKN
jgi:poly-gamma-glutamate synthesis protein (capsule biosynthesis protein)